MVYVIIGVVVLGLAIYGVSQVLKSDKVKAEVAVVKADAAKVESTVAAVKAAV